jgi:hypothetical protein
VLLHPGYFTDKDGGRFFEFLLGRWRRLALEGLSRWAEEADTVAGKENGGQRK